jgi:gluconate 2-dehydrogenase subunit 3-like protein
MASSLTRRRFLELGASATALVLACRRERSIPALIALTDAEYAATAAACERILPRDEDPGAIDLGVADYVDRALAGDRAGWRDRFRAGLRGLDDAARRRAGAPFGELAAALQDQILDDWQDGTPAQVEFVRMLIELTFEGAFGDPSHGGNRDGRGWQLIGFAPCEPRHHTG